MKSLLVLAAALATGSTLAPSPTPAQTAPDAVSYVETELRADGSMATRTSADGRADTRYQAGSVSKYACTIAALDLQRAGKLRLSDTIADLLPGYTGARAGAITLEQLLQNRSGIADGLMTAVRADRDGTLALEMTPLEAVNRFATGYTDAAPGTEFDYVIINWAFVQAILERASGQSIHTVLRERVYVPAGMTESTSFVGTLPGPDAVQPGSYTMPMPGYLVCAGGTASTPGDLIKLLRYPYTPAYPEADRAALAAVASPNEGDPASGYALGGRTLTVSVGGVTHHLSWKSGSNGAFKSRVVYDPVTDTGYAIMTNEDADELLAARATAWVRDTLGAEID